MSAAALAPAAPQPSRAGVPGGRPEYTVNLFLSELTHWNSCAGECHCYTTGTSWFVLVFSLFGFD